MLFTLLGALVCFSSLWLGARGDALTECVMRVRQPWLAAATRNYTYSVNGTAFHLTTTLFQSKNETDRLLHACAEGQVYRLWALPKPPPRLLTDETTPLVLNVDALFAIGENAQSHLSLVFRTNDYLVSRASAFVALTPACMRPTRPGAYNSNAAVRTTGHDRDVQNARCFHTVTRGPQTNATDAMDLLARRLEL